MPEANIEAIGGWNRNTQNTIYAPIPPANDVALLAGFKNMEAFCVPRALLDPSTMPEFRPLVHAIFPTLEQELQAMRQVRPCFTSPWVRCLHLFDTYTCK